MGGAIDYLLLSDLNAISNDSKKKHPQLRDASEKLVQLIKSCKERHVDVEEELSKSESTLRPFQFACETKQVKLISMTLGLMQKLIAYTCIPRTLILELISSYIDILHYGFEIQLKVVQSILPLVNNYGKGLSGDTLSKLFLLCFQLHSSHHAVVASAASATLLQLVLFVFDSVKDKDGQFTTDTKKNWADRLHADPTCLLIDDTHLIHDNVRPQNPSDTSAVTANNTVAFAIRLKDAYLLLRDIAQLAHQHPAAWIHLDASPSLVPLMLEWLDTIVVDHRLVFSEYAAFQHLLSSSILPLVIPLSSASTAQFPLMVRRLRLASSLLLYYPTLLPTHVVALFRAITDLFAASSTPLWQKCLCVETVDSVLRGGPSSDLSLFLALFPLLRSELSTFLQSLVATVDSLILSELVLPSAPSPLYKASLFDQLDKTELLVPVTDHYLILTSLSVVMRLADLLYHLIAEMHASEKSGSDTISHRLPSLCDLALRSASFSEENNMNSFNSNNNNNNSNVVLIQASIYRTSLSLSSTTTTTSTLVSLYHTVAALAAFLWTRLRTLQLDERVESRSLTTLAAFVFFSFYVKTYQEENDTGLLFLSLLCQSVTAASGELSASALQMLLLVIRTLTVHFNESHWHLIHSTFSRVFQLQQAQPSKMSTPLQKGSVPRILSTAYHPTNPLLSYYESDNHNISHSDPLSNPRSAPLSALLSQLDTLYDRAYTLDVSFVSSLCRLADTEDSPTNHSHYGVFVLDRLSHVLRPLEELTQESRLAHLRIVAHFLVAQLSQTARIATTCDLIKDLGRRALLRCTAVLPVERILHELFHDMMHRYPQHVLIQRTCVESIYLLLQSGQVSSLYGPLMALLRAPQLPDVVRMAFQCVSALVHDHLARIVAAEDLDALCRCVGAYVYIYQEDLNQSLSAIGLFHDLAERVKRQPAQLLTLFGEMETAITRDPRQDIKHGATQTLFRTAALYGHEWCSLEEKEEKEEDEESDSVQLWTQSLQLMLRVVDTIQSSYETSDASQQQWDETRIVTVDGLGYLASHFMSDLLAITGIHTLYRDILQALVFFLYHGRRAVSLHAAEGLQRMSVALQQSTHASSAAAQLLCTTLYDTLKYVFQEVVHEGNVELKLALTLISTLDTLLSVMDEHRKTVHGTVSLKEDPAIEWILVLRAALLMPVVYYSKEDDLSLHAVQAHVMTMIEQRVQPLDAPWTQTAAQLEALWSLVELVYPNQRAPIRMVTVMGSDPTRHPLQRKQTASSQSLPLKRDPMQRTTGGVYPVRVSQHYLGFARRLLSLMLSVYQRSRPRQGMSTESMALLTRLLSCLGDMMVRRYDNPDAAWLAGGDERRWPFSLSRQASLMLRAMMPSLQEHDDNDEEEEEKSRMISLWQTYIEVLHRALYGREMLIDPGQQQQQPSLLLLQSAALYASDEQFDVTLVRDVFGDVRDASAILPLFFTRVLLPGTRFEPRGFHRYYLSAVMPYTRRALHALCWQLLGELVLTSDHSASDWMWTVVPLAMTRCEEVLAGYLAHRAVYGEFPLEAHLKEELLRVLACLGQLRVPDGYVLRRTEENAWQLKSEGGDVERGFVTHLYPLLVQCLSTAGWRGVEDIQQSVKQLLEHHVAVVTETCVLLNK